MYLKQNPQTKCSNQKDKSNYPCLIACTLSLNTPSMAFPSMSLWFHCLQPNHRRHEWHSCELRCRCSDWGPSGLGRWWHWTVRSGAAGDISCSFGRQLQHCQIWNQPFHICRILCRIALGNGCIRCLDRPQSCTGRMLINQPRSGGQPLDVLLPQLCSGMLCSLQQILVPPQLQYRYQIQTG